MPVPDYNDRYNTPLSPADEARFQAYLQDSGKAGDLRDYDLRGAWKSNAKATANGHLTDVYKKPNHPTFSTGSTKYQGAGGETGGTFAQLPDGRWGFTPSATNLNMYGPEGLREYMQRGDPDVQLAMPQRADGGSVSVDYGTPGLAPSPETMNPAAKATAQQFMAMDANALQQLVLRAGNSAQGQIARRILQQKRMQPAESAPAVKIETQGFAAGGMTNPPWARRQEAGLDDDPVGFLHSDVAGRTDHLSIAPRTNSYVIPADVISGLGEGNSLAGARFMDIALGRDPTWAKLPPVHRGPGPPRASAPHVPQEEARGGATREPIMAAGAEYVVPPHVVQALGRGDTKRGHDLLDKFVVAQRKRIIDEMRKLPGPVKS